MLEFVIAGLVLGAIYALAASGLVITYVSTGVLNFAFAGLAYFIARFYFFLLVQHKWGILPSAVVSLAVGGPVLGSLLYLVLFRLLRQATQVIKVVATIGLSVALPSIAILLFSNIQITTAPGLAPEPVHVFHVLNVAVTLDQVIAYACVVALLVCGVVILRFTEIGLRVRAMVDSEAMTSISGTNPSVVSLGVWAVSIFLAGLCGILAAPIISLNSGAFQVLIAGAFAAVVAAELRRLGVAVLVGLAMGVVGAIGQWALPPSSSLAQAVVPSIPFAFIVVFLGYALIRSGSVSESTSVGGLLDKAVRPQGGEASRATTKSLAPTRREPRNAILDGHNVGAAASVAVMVILPLVLPKFWGSLVGEVMALAIILLSMSLVTGEGGMIWLCEITFAGVGAIASGQLATNHGWPVLAAIVAGGLIAATMGALIGLVTVRLGDLYVALVTLTFALLMSDLVFTRNIFYQLGAGVSVPAPSFARSPDSFDYFSIVAFVLLAVIVYNVRRSTIGLALGAIRSSPQGAKSIGVSVVQAKVLVSTLAACLAGVGGGILASYVGTASPDTYNVFAGLVWLAVLVAVGLRSNAAAVVAAASFVFLPAVFSKYLPISLAQVPTALFGLGAVLVARNPEGVLTVHVRQLRYLHSRLRPESTAETNGIPSAAVTGPVPGSAAPTLTSMHMNDPERLRARS